MRINRSILAFVILALLLSSIFLLPEQPPIKESAIIPKLPARIAEWVGQKEYPSDREIEILGQDTDFERRNYIRIASSIRNNSQDLFKNKIDFARASIVLSGNDMNQSIHRAERCLKAQGFNIERQDKIILKSKSGLEIPVKRNYATKLDINGEKFSLLMYYWFVGHDYITHDHYKRTLKDIFDRVIGGYDQKWGYISMSILLDKITFQNQAEKPEYKIEEAEKIVAELFAELFDEVHKKELLNSKSLFAKMFGE